MNTYIVDTTLRDGEQSPGVIFKHSEKFKIAQLLDKLGIEEVELGTPAMGKHEQAVIRDIAMAGFGFNTISWCRALKKDIDMAIRCKTKALSISFPVSHILLSTMGKDEDWVRVELPKLIAYARMHFESVYIGLQDASRCERKFLIEVVDLAVRSGADRIRIADTVGIFTPLDTMAMFADLSYEFPGFDFEFHPHNDLGMATANAFVALKYGARGISGTINGIGERAGNVAIEELIMASCLKNNHTSYHTPIIHALCNYVARVAHMPLHKNKPVCGPNAFTHETGVHVRSVLENKLAYQPFDEALIGLESNRIIIGKHSGKAALAHFFSLKGKHLGEDQLKRIHDKIQDSIVQRGIIPTEQYILSLYQNMQVSSL